MFLNTRRSLYSLAASPVLIAALFAGGYFGEYPDAPYAAPSPPLAIPDLASAKQTTTVMTNALVAAVFSISDTVPNGASQDDIQASSAAVSALLPGCQKTYRLIDASGDPLDRRNIAAGKFEADGLMALVLGAPLVQETVGGQLRTLVPLRNNSHTNCVTCHTNYGTLAPGTVVGAASLRVRL